MTDAMIDAEIARQKTKKSRLLLGLGFVVLLVVAGFIGVAIGASGDSDDTASRSTVKTADPAKATTYTMSPAEQAAAAQRSAEAKVKRDAELAAAQEELRAKADPASYEQITERDWQLLTKDPDANTGRKIVLYGSVTQFDSGTGTTAFRANTAGEQMARSYDYDVNTLVREGTRGAFDQVVKDDLVTLYVEIEGTETYDTTMGGSTTVPVVNAYIVEVTGSD